MCQLLSAQTGFFILHAISDVAGSQLYFINYVGFGFDGQVVSYKTLQKTLLPKRLSYIRPILKALQELQTYEFHLKLDGKPDVVEGINLIITNIPLYSAGIRIYPEAKMDDKMFEISFMKKIPAPGNIALLPFIIPSI